MQRAFIEKMYKFLKSLASDKSQPNVFLGISLAIILFTPFGNHLHNVCSECKYEAKRLIQNYDYANKVSPEQKDSRRNSSSNYPISHLSPGSKVERLKKD